MFARSLAVPSDILTVTLPRPLGVVLEYDERFRRATVVDLIEGTNADQRRKVRVEERLLGRSGLRWQEARLKGLPYTLAHSNIL